MACSSSRYTARTCWIWSIQRIMLSRMSLLELWLSRISRSGEHQFLKWWAGPQRTQVTSLLIFLHLGKYLNRSPDILIYLQVRSQHQSRSRPSQVMLAITLFQVAVSHRESDTSLIFQSWPNWKVLMKDSLSLPMSKDLIWLIRWSQRHTMS